MDLLVTIADSGNEMHRSVRMSHIRVNKTFLLVVAVALLLAVYLYFSYSAKMSQHQAPAWTKRFDFNKEVPTDLLEKAKKVKISEEKKPVEIAGVKVTVFTRSAKPTTTDKSKIPVLFLHGAAFSSKTWQDLGSLGLVAAMGHPAVAIDIPGFGNTPSAKGLNNAKFIQEVIAKTDIANPAPIIVLASMSGGYGLPYIMADPGTAHDRVSGIIAIAPVSTGDYSAEKYYKVEPVTLIVRGEKDNGLGQQALSNLQSTRKNIYREIKGAGHAAYMDDTKTWQKLLYNFVNGIQMDIK